MADGHAGEPGVGEASHTSGHRSVEVMWRTCDGDRPEALGPQSDVRVVMHDGDRRAPARRDYMFGHGLGQGGACGSREDARQPELGIAKALDGDEHGVTAERDVHRGQCTVGTMGHEVAVIGAGAWGTTVASLASRSARTVLWARREEIVNEVATRHTNTVYLPGRTLGPWLGATASVADALEGVSAVVMGVPSHGFRGALEAVRGNLPAGVPILSLTKGIEQGSGRRMTEIIAELCPGNPAGVLTGPNLAQEVIDGQPSACVVAFDGEGFARDVQRLLTTPTFRVYTSTDIVGCEIAGSVKNVMAIAAGICDGLGFGENTRATLITRGLAELSRLGVKLGADAATFAGLAGVGDMVATCTSGKSRNHTVGFRLARGVPLDAIVSEMRMVAEGVKTTEPLLHLAASHGVELPIAAQVQAVLTGASTPTASIEALMRRRVASELQGRAR